MNKQFSSLGQLCTPLTLNHLNSELKSALSSGCAAVALFDSHAWARFISPAWSVELTWPLPIIRISSFCHGIATKKEYNATEMTRKICYTYRGRLKIPAWSKNPSCALQLFRNSSAQSSEIRLITAIRTRILSEIQIGTIA